MKRTLLILTLLFSAALSAQDLEQPNPKKIGLVLSGGGAKGFAHIGVLKVIDSLGIKVDYIAGTSMGAIVGSLYASGYSGKQLDSIFNSVNFDNVINDIIPRSSRTLYERDNTEKYAIVLPFDRFKLKLPSSLSRGQNVFNLLSKLTLHVSEIHDFDKLPIPFFCVATNVETGNAVILDSGNLALSVTASGAFPTLFQPVEIDGALLIDGGVINNYPIEELRAKGIDIIIGVDVQDGLATRKDMTSAPDVLLQINNFRTIKDMIPKREKTDIYINPDIKGFTVIDFSQGRKIIESGAKAALDKLDELETLTKYGSGVISEKMDLRSKDSIRINSINIKGNDRYTKAYIMGKLKLKGNETVDYDLFDRGVNNLIATNNFNSFIYAFKRSKGEEGYDLEANLKESKISTFIKFGLHYDDVYKSAALLNLTKKRLLFKNDFASLDIILGDNVRYNFEYLIDKGFYWSIGIRSRYNQFQKSINAELFLDDSQIAGTGINKIDVKLRDQTNQFYIQTLFRKDFAISLGAEHKRLNVKSETITIADQTGDFVFENTDYFSVFGSLKLDTYDNPYYPSSGLYFSGYFHTYLLASGFNTNFTEFSIAKAEAGYAFSVSNRLSFNFKTSGGFKVGEDNTQSLNFALGGYGNKFINNFIPFLGYDYISLIGDSYVKGYVGMDYKLFQKHHLTLEANIANVDNNIFETGEWFTLPDYRGYALGYGIESFLGPIQVKYSYAPELKESTWYFNLGFWF
ncbi:patatin [Subsaximicrobium wynnwilliamsii]|uniref:Patatin n=1 Tax=Subsaximicrobium wynnwilliamsii TaxID=291179 RepID=A0A5C6ZH13_9FLAO|nr:patatin-like phospholipase family protein [Subsaximicrobium wynnwilliamsii]TXD82522.1 patatin [Subsaximicrobium wynnwilliamsii]TXD88165.1 patatin [Subsaximicrobium wynnwilliamsii]TXE02180.1 patatin [Subsaximicrobium wynnwilliamsii]